MTVTSAPIGSTGQSLDGFAVNANVPDAFRESVVLTDPNDPLGAAAIVSTQPISAYGLPVWLQGSLSGVSSTFVVNPSGSATVSTFPTGVTSTFAVNAANPVSSVVVSSVPHALVGTSQVFGQVSTFPTGVSSTFAVNALATVSTQIVSSLPIFVAQSSAPWDVRGAVAVSSATAIVSTVVISSAPHAIVGTSQIFGTVSTQIVSSLPMFVSQSSAPWDVRGGINISSQTGISSSWPLSTTLVSIVSSLPQFVAQSSAPWIFVETISTAGGTQSSTYNFAANLNTTVVKAAAGQVYGIMGSNVGSSNVFVRLYNLSTAALTIASTAVPKMVFGLPISSAPVVMTDVGVNFPNGISFIVQQQPFTASSSVPPTASTAVITILFA